MRQRTATLNRIRGLLNALGMVLPLKAATVRREAALVLKDLPGRAHLVIGDLLSDLHRLDEHSHGPDGGASLALPAAPRAWRSGPDPAAAG